MDGKDATSHGSSPVGLERFETDHQIINRRGNTPRPPTPGPMELKDVVVQKDQKKDA